MNHQIPIQTTPGRRQGRQVMHDFVHAAAQQELLLMTPEPDESALGQAEGRFRRCWDEFQAWARVRSCLESYEEIVNALTSVTISEVRALPNVPRGQKTLAIHRILERAKLFDPLRA